MWGNTCEMWGNTCDREEKEGRVCEILVRLPMKDGAMETVEYM